MDNLLEILVPLIFAAIYFFGNMLSGKSREDEDAPPGMPRRRDSEDEDADAIERQRRIQEEIRRKIMERRRASEGEGPPQMAPSGQELRERRREVEARRETREAQKETREVVHETPDVPPFVAPTHEASPEATPPAFSWDNSDNAYESAMEEQLKRIEATKRQAEQLKRQASAATERTDTSSTKRRAGKGRYFSGPVRETLTDPAAARAAFVYAEVLGQPISMRKGTTVPGLN